MKEWEGKWAQKGSEYLQFMPPNPKSWIKLVSIYFNLAVMRPNSSKVKQC